MAILHIILVSFHDSFQQTFIESLKTDKHYSRGSGYSNDHQRQKSLALGRLHFSWIGGTQSTNKYIGKIDIMTHGDKCYRERNKAEKGLGT